MENSLAARTFSLFEMMTAYKFKKERVIRLNGLFKFGQINILIDIQMRMLTINS